VLGKAMSDNVIIWICKASIAQIIYALNNPKFVDGAAIHTELFTLLQLQIYVHERPATA